MPQVCDARQSLQWHADTVLPVLCTRCEYVHWQRLGLLVVLLKAPVIVLVLCPRDSTNSAEGLIAVTVTCTHSTCSTNGR